MRCTLIGIGVVFVLLFAAGYAWPRYTFPDGESHCCSKQIGLALRMCAWDNERWFPSGGGTSESSLSLLVTSTRYTGLYALHGQTIPLDVAQAACDSDGHLRPESYEWHYVEGLRGDDDPRIAVVWDKVGLGHNGQRLKQGGHEVLFLDGSTSYVPESRWEGSLEEQERLVAALETHKYRLNGQ